MQTSQTLQAKFLHLTVAHITDVRSALTDVITNVVQNGADVADELQTAQDTVEFNIEG